MNAVKKATNNTMKRVGSPKYSLGSLSPVSLFRHDLVILRTWYKDGSDICDTGSYDNPCRKKEEDIE